MSEAIFDSWADRYDAWFHTPVGRLIKEYETELLLGQLTPRSDETILDVGCGTGIFTQAVMASGARITGVDLSTAMLRVAVDNLGGGAFQAACADMMTLPFKDETFDRAFSMTTVEFVPDIRGAVEELNRVTRSGGTIVMTTLNSLSPWAERRTQKARNGHSLFQHVHFRSPDDLRTCLPENAVIETTIHFQKDDPLPVAMAAEEKGRENHLDTGAFIAAQWIKQA
jgi:ubiquinone/menaquinone biosynthesis C-methylase UbiE